MTTHTNAVEVPTTLLVIKPTHCNNKADTPRYKADTLSTHCNNTTIHCNTLQHTATHYNTLQRTATHSSL